MTLFGGERVKGWRAGMEEIGGNRLKVSDIFLSLS